MPQSVGIDLPLVLKKARTENTDTVTINATLPGGTEIDIVIHVFGVSRAAPAQGVGDVNVFCN